MVPIVDPEPPEDPQPIAAAEASVARTTKAVLVCITVGAPWRLLEQGPSHLRMSLFKWLKLRVNIRMIGKLEPDIEVSLCQRVAHVAIPARATVAAAGTGRSSMPPC